ncbi:MAG: MerR family transcriptional regulator [Bacteroidota bacterium]
MVNTHSGNKGKKYYRIGEVARLLHVSTSLIRFWETKIPSLQPHKDKKGNRQYTQIDIDRLRQVYHLTKEQGYTLQGASAAMKQTSKPPEGNEAVLQTLKSLRSFLVDLKAHLHSK